MPEGLELGLTAQQFTHLIEYLISLKEPASVLSIRQGMPSVIPELTKQMIRT